MGLAQSVPGTHDVSVRISNSFHAPHINANYSEALRGYISEMEWHHITTSLETVTAAAGSAEQVKPSLEFYNGGSPAYPDLESYLKEERTSDRRLGYTAYGPHKADIKFLIEKKKIAGESV